MKALYSRLFRLVRRLHGDRSGASLVEFAIVAPIFLLLLAGIVELGSAMNQSIIVASAARAGVEYGAQNLVTAEDVSGMVSAAIADGGNEPGLSATASYACTCADGSASTCLDTDCSSSYRIVRVTVTATDAFAPFLTVPGAPDVFSLTQTAIREVSI